LEAIRNLLNQLGPKRLAMMGGVALALLGALAWVATRSTTTSMGFLYTDLDPSAAQSISEKLKTQNVPYQLSADGTSILAPQDKLAELRMSMAGERLGGKIGYEVLDNEQPFGVSAERAKLNETRAIEGELAKSIQSLNNVTAARVHIVMPERAMFATETRKATAAVTVKTKGRLPSEAVQSIRYLVSSSVPELAPESISVVDQTGALLARAGDPDSAGASDADERQAGIESKMRDEIEALLEPIVGQGKVRAEVSAQVDRDQTREESNSFDPDKQVVAHQVSVETGDTNAEQDAAQQSASISNQLPGAQQGNNGNGPTRNSQSKQTSEDTTYDNSSTHTVTVRTPGKITRLTVAVMVDGGLKGLPATQIANLTKIVENAVGADPSRGDSVLVQSMAFHADDTLAETKTGWLSMVSSGQIIGLVEVLVIAGVGLIALRMLKPKFLPPPPVDAMGAAALGHAPTIDATALAIKSPELAAIAVKNPELAHVAERAADGDLEAIAQIAEHTQSEAQQMLDQEVALAQVDGRIKLSALKRIGETITTNPPEAAAVIRHWMNN
jgi:flagellar M-ring protein FliF